MTENSREAAKQRRNEEERDDVSSQSESQNLESLGTLVPPHETLPSSLNIEELSAIVVDCSYKLHVEAGPGLYETVYEVVLAKMLQDRGLKVVRQLPIPICLMGYHFDEGFRADIIVEDRLLLELKSVERLAPVHSKQVLTYLRLLKLPLGLLINFGAATFKEGCHRIVNNHQNFASSRLRVNQDHL